MAERGGFEPPAAQNDDGSEEFDVIDIPKLKTEPFTPAFARTIRVRQKLNGRVSCFQREGGKLSRSIYQLIWLESR